MMVRGIRGAITVEENSSRAILAATRELLCAIVDRNAIAVDQIAAVFFTTTPDLNADFPAVGARQLGWHHVPLLCGHEMNVPGALPACIRVLVLVNTDKAQDEIEHVYLRDAVTLRTSTPPIEE
ncbi:MAG: chorismate mutase [Chloroflexota bacterium]|nr:chorismate mutase [Dehalococcoidia bacterium]MDW8252349.1 chorismate mutase [Chloroflexota bacterium]